MPAFSLVQSPPNGLPLGFTPCTTLPYPTQADKSTWHCYGFGGALQPRYIIGAEPLDQ